MEANRDWNKIGFIRVYEEYWLTKINNIMVLEFADIQQNREGINISIHPKYLRERNFISKEIFQEKLQELKSTNLLSIEGTHFIKQIVPIKKVQVDSSDNMITIKLEVDTNASSERFNQIHSLLYAK